MMNTNKVNGDNNDTAGRDIHKNIYSVNNYEELEFGVLTDIFDYVISESQNIIIADNNKALTKDKLIHLEEKIKINFPDKETKDEVKKIFTQLYSKYVSVEKFFKTLDEENQSDIHFCISSKYNDLKREDIPQITILKQLASTLIPPKQINNPMYKSIAQAIVLLFFDDCTIFEKTIEEDTIPTLFD